MRTILVATLVSAFTAHAGLDIQCKLSSSAVDFQLQRDDQTILMTNVLRENGGDLDVIGLDGNVMEQPTIPEWSGFIEVGFSNECDNDYGFALPVEALRELAAGNLATVDVLVEYANSDSPMTATNNVITQTAVLSCRKATQR